MKTKKGKWFEVGQPVKYFSVIRDEKPCHLGIVHYVVPDGIPSCNEPMLMLEGKAGVVLASHCESVTLQEYISWHKLDAQILGGKG